jgi:Restriction alleviation protein Lar
MIGAPVSDIPGGRLLHIPARALREDRMGHHDAHRTYAVHQELSIRDTTMELQPCPFCGSKAALSVVDDTDRDCNWFWVSCRLCKFGQPESLYKAGAAAESAWNDRCAELLVNSPKKYA